MQGKEKEPSDLTAERLSTKMRVTADLAAGVHLLHLYNNTLISVSI